MKIVPVIQGSLEWHEFRKPGIGGSEAPIIDGSSPYRKRNELLLEKLGGPSERISAKKRELFQRGHETEAHVRALFAELTGEAMNPICGIHDQFEYIRCSYDGLSQRLGVMECKMVGAKVLHLAKTENKIPEHHYIQIQHALEVAGADIGHWMGKAGTQTAIIPVPRDAERTKRLLDLEHQFWDDVQNRRVPRLPIPRTRRSRAPIRVTEAGVRVTLESDTDTVHLSDPATLQRILRERWAAQVAGRVESKWDLTIRVGLGGR